MIFKLMEGFQTHHKKNMEKNFKSEDGKMAKNDDENAEILKTFFSSLFNSQAKVDFSVLDEIPKHETQHNLGRTQSKQRSRQPYQRWHETKHPARVDLLLL